ncbi:MAG TPA: hypothetical protein VKK79_00480, partial [Candidatus Lokiarchaeia archaeon]|nr:hypothetical protein [Candidatus Lokiarchaeia archaeon]
MVVVIFITTCFISSLMIARQNAPNVQNSGSPQSTTHPLAATLAVTNLTTANYSYFYGTTGNVLRWNITDNVTGNTPTYAIYRNNSKVAFGNWINYTTGWQVNYSIDGWAVGHYNVTINASNGLSHVSQNQINVTVNPGGDLLLSQPSDITYAAGATGNWINWTVTDPSTGPSRTCSVTRDGQGVPGSPVTWVSGGNISVNVDNLTVGSYSYVCFVSDNLSDTNSSTVEVTVNMGNDLVLSQPNDQTFAYGSKGHWINWTVTDPTVGNSPTYQLWNNGTPQLYESGTWFNGGNLLVDFNWSTYYWNPTNVTGTFGQFNLAVNVSSSFAGTTAYYFEVNDGVNGASDQAMSTVYVTVTTPSVDLTLTHPGNMTFQAGTSGHSITWIATDPSVGITNYTIAWNGHVNQTGLWTSTNPITYLLNNMDYGVYTLTILVGDGQRDSATDTDTINVTQNIIGGHNDLHLSHATPVNYAYGTFGHVLNWTPSDLTVGGGTGYQITWNGTYNTYVNSSFWTSGNNITQNVDGLPIGSYQYNITVWDGWGDTNSDSTVVTVTTQNATGFISLPQPSNVSFYFGNGNNHQITWIIQDVFTGSSPIYSITLNNSNWQQSGTWTGGLGQSFSVYLDNLNPGTYLYTFFAWNGLSDIHCDSAISTVFVNVTNALALTQPSNISYVYGSTGHNITWTVMDPLALSNTNYNIFGNSTPQYYQSGLWYSGQNLTANVDGFFAGNYTFYLNVDDNMGNHANSAVFVTVTISSVDLILPHAGDQNFAAGTTGHSLSWTPNDPTVGSTHYDIAMNGGIDQSGSWTSGVPISFN